mgnify:CR=1 FL=1
MTLSASFYNGIEVVAVKEINIGRAIVEGRRRKGITQEDLAQYMGVSKASVSKWETGQSYPDITLLPQLAAYFNISIDDLLGYEPQMEKDDIRRLYHRLAQDFSAKPFDAVVAECDAIIRKYFSCFPLLLQMAVLLLNHVHLAPTQEVQHEMFETIKGLCVRIKEESGHVDLNRQANFIEALCELNLGNPAVVIDLMAGVNDPVLGDEVLLASAYHQIGDIEKAKETTQIGIFRHLMGILADVPNYLMLNLDDPVKYDQIIGRTLGLIELFNVKRLHPAILFGVYLTGAQGYAMLGRNDEALNLLQEYVDLAASGVFPLEFTGDEFFDRVQNWYKDFDLGVKPPRSDAVIQESLIEGMTQNPAFEHLSQNPRFRAMVTRLARHFESRGD